MTTRINTTFINPVDHGAKLNDPSFDNATIINDLIKRMPLAGGSIVLPSYGEMWLNSPIIPNDSYVTISGMNAGTRSNIDPDSQVGLTHPGGGSKLILGDQCETAILCERRPGAPRISSLQLSNFLIQGRGTHRGQTGINVDHDNDAVRILGISTINLDTGIRMRGADAAMIRGCWISEVRNSIQALGSSQQLQIANNHIGAQPLGKGIYLENPNWANVIGNHIYPDGHAAIEAIDAYNSQFDNNIQSYYTGAIIIKGNNNTISGKVQALRSNGLWVADPVGRDGYFGLIHIEGNDNEVTASINSAQPSDHTRILIASGNDNWVTNTKISGAWSNRRVVINGACRGTRIVHSAHPADVDKGGSNAEVVW